MATSFFILFIFNIEFVKSELSVFGLSVYIDKNHIIGLSSLIDIYLLCVFVLRHFNLNFNELLRRIKITKWKIEKNIKLAEKLINLEEKEGDENLIRNNKVEEFLSKLEDLNKNIRILFSATTAIRFFIELLVDFIMPLSVSFLALGRVHGFELANTFLFGK